MKLTWTKTSPRFMEAALPSGDVYKLVRDRYDTRYWHASWTPAEEQAAGTLFNFKVTDSEGTPAWAKQKAAAHAEKVQEKRAAGATWTGEAWRYAAKKNPGALLRGRPARAGAKRPAVKRNPLSASYEEGLKKARQIGIDNAETAIDQRKTYPSVRAAYAAYIVNAIDTVTEYKLPSREAAVQAFLDHVAKPKRRK